ncbi:STM4014 family protein [Alienimonas sp. DA493]|uniref:STM4014 family protein n=1 Tax=Alienimonas sp. DA493 TaxID=3373605 RepID=UPI00375477DB
MTREPPAGAPLRRWALVGNPENRRVALFQQALADRGEPPALLLSWFDLLTGRRSIGEVPAGAVLRVDSPGENWAVEKALLAAGRAAAEAEGSPVLGGRALAEWEEDRGRILHPRQWFLGLRETLHDWDRRLAGRGVRWTAPAAGMLCLFDKLACQSRLAAAGVPVPPALSPRPVGGFEELADRMAAADCDRAFVKLAHGSSASGVVALRRGRTGWTAVTSAELVRGPLPAGGRSGLRLYNSLKIRRYAALDDVRDLIDELARHRLHAERWLPKASLGGRAFDLRIVSIAGAPRHTVVRTARGPLTNLHLGGRRGDAAAVRRLCGPERWAAVLDTVRRAAAAFPETLTIGFDVLIAPGGRSHAVLEANAFGDLLPGVTDRGEDTYAAQIAAVAAVAAGGRSALIRRPAGGPAGGPTARG